MYINNVKPIIIQCFFRKDSVHVKYDIVHDQGATLPSNVQSPHESINRQGSICTIGLLGGETGCTDGQDPVRLSAISDCPA